MFTSREGSKAAAAAPGLLGSAKHTSPGHAELRLTPALLVLPHLELFWSFIPRLLLRFSPFILKCSQNMLHIEAGGNLTGLCGLTAPLFSFGPDPHTFCCTLWYHRLRLWVLLQLLAHHTLAHDPNSPCLSPGVVKGLI